MFLFLLHFFLASLGTLTGDERLYPTFESRVRLSHYYYSIPIIPNDSDQFIEYDEQLSANDPHYNGKVIEFDSLGYLNEHQSIHHKLPYLVANPALRKVHISPEWCSLRSFFMIGYRIHQIYREQGLPYSVPCSTCHPTIEGLNNVYFLLPQRHYYKDITLLGLSGEHILIETRANQSIDYEQKSQIANFQNYFQFNDLYFGQWSRWSGENAASEQDRHLIGTSDGQLSIFSKNVLKGFTTTCGMELNSETVSSNIFVNGDVIHDHSRQGEAFTYNSYESFALEKEFVQDRAMNLQLIVSWDDWGCCSACCCPPAACGHNLHTSSDCENVYSARSRVGHLSIKKIVLEKEIVLKTKNQSTELSTTLELPPYSTRGIPIFSSIFSESDSVPDQFEEIKSILIPLFLNANNISSYNFSSGMFLTSESCKSHIQKTDCAEWAKCNNFPLMDIQKQDKEKATDTCNQVPFVDVLVGIDALKVRVGKHENLRIRMDPEVHNMNRTKANWLVNLRKPKKYDRSKSCILQDTVLRNDELLILDFSRFDAKIDLVLNEKQKIRIVFVSSEKEIHLRMMNSIVVFWAITISVFLFLLVIGSVYMHQEKTARLEKKIKFKKEAHCPNIYDKK